MGYILLPTLQQAAVVRTALLLYHQCELKKIQIRKPRGERVEMEIDEKLSSLLATSLGKRVVKVIHTVQLQVDHWKVDHEFVLKHIGGCCCVHLCWKTGGTINRIQTSKRIVANENVNPLTRFIMACTYFHEEEVVALWDEYKEIENHVAEYYTNVAVRFWLEWLKEEDTKHWSEMIDGFLRNHRWLPWDNPMNASCFYHLLSRRSKQSLDLFDTSQVSIFDFFECVNKMSDTERIKVIRRKPLTMLKRCLMWPFRSLFISMAKEVVNYLSVVMFINVTVDMLWWYRLHEDFEDFHVFETFWQISPTALKDKAKKNEDIIRHKDKLLEDENVPGDIKDILRKCLN